MKKLLILCAFFMPFFVSAANTPQVNDFANSSRIYRRQLSLTAGKQYKFRTFSSGDSVLYLLNSSNVQVAMNDDCGSDCLSTQDSNDSTLTYTPTTTGTYHLVMRNYYSGRVGETANLQQFTNGTAGTMLTNLPLGGIKQSIPAWDAYSQTSPIVAWRKLYFYYFNTDKNASGGASAADTVLYLVSNNAIAAYNDDGGSRFSSKIERTSGSCSSGCYIFGGAHSSSSNSEGNARLIVDPYTNLGDLDYDGLSDALESVLGTSSSIFLLAGKDTDKDGLNDYLETLGNENILLPWEGASPTQKDVFVEVDYFGRTIEGNFVNFLKDHETYIKTQLTSSFDRYGDIRLHIDIDDYLGEMSDAATLKFATLDEEPATNPNSSAYYLRTKMSTDFTSSRHGIYRWVVAANRHSSVTNGSSGLSLRPGNILIVSLGSWNSGGTQEQYTGTTMHELGHAFGLTHNDNGNNNSSGPNSIIHRSVMNYRYQTSGAPKNIEFSFPPYIIADSIWRYSTDNSLNRQELDWNYNNIVANTGENGCLNSETEANQSPKQICVNARPNALPTCDCTFNEWAILDLASGVNVVEAAFISSGILSENTSPNDPFFGLEGYVVALNLEDLMTSGEKYTKIDKFQDAREKEPSADEKFYTKENRKIYNDAFEDYFRKMGYKENEDFFITDDKVFLINKEE